MDTESAPLLELVDRVAREAFSISLRVSSTRSLTDGPAAGRLDRTIAALDGLVRGRPHIALACGRSLPTVHPPRPVGNGGRSPQGADPGAWYRISDASLVVHRAQVALATTTSS